MSSLIAYHRNMRLPAPLVEYRVDEGSGQVLTDYSGNNHHGQLGSTSGSDTNDPTWISSGLSFDGVDDYVTLPHPLNLNNDFSIFVACKPSASGTGVAWSAGSSSSASPDIRLAFRTGTPNTTFLQAFDDTGTAIGIRVITRVETPCIYLAERRSGELYLHNLTIQETSVITAPATAGTMTLNQQALGARRRTTVTNFLAGEVYMMMAFAKAFNSRELAIVADYIRRLKGGLGL